MAAPPAGHRLSRATDDVSGDAERRPTARARRRRRPRRRPRARDARRRPTTTPTAPETTPPVTTGSHGDRGSDHDVLVPRNVAALVGRAERARRARRRARQRRRREGRRGGAVGGDAGVGKTRLLGEVIAAATERAMTVSDRALRRPRRHPTAVPRDQRGLRPARRRPIRAASSSCSTATLRSPASCPAAGPAVPRTDSTGVSCSRPSWARSGDLANEQPLLLVVEDAHWADQATRDLLGFLFTRVDAERLAIIVSYRSDDLHRRHPLRPTLAQWARLPAVTRVQLDPLRAEDVRSLVRAIHPEPFADSASRRHRQSRRRQRVLRRGTGRRRRSARGAGHLPWQLADLLLVRLDGPVRRRPRGRARGRRGRPAGTHTMLPRSSACRPSASTPRCARPSTRTCCN